MLWWGRLQPANPSEARTLLPPRLNPAPPGFPSQFHRGPSVAQASAHPRWFPRYTPTPGSPSCQQPDSRTSRVPVRFAGVPIECAGFQVSRPRPNSLGRRLRLGLVDAPDIRHQPRNRLTVPRDHDLLATLHTVQQRCQSVLASNAPISCIIPAFKKLA